MACTTISDALGILHDRKLQQLGLQRLDSPTEAALVAQLANRQRGETVIVSVGDPKPAGEGYCFAHMAPPHILGSEKMRHNYVLAQHAYYCGLKLADQKGLSTPRQLREQQQEPEPIPCSSAAPAPCDHAEVADAATPSCRTPLSQLRAEQQQQLEDSSPCNNIVRRLAANIKAGSPALRVTLEEYSSLVRRTTSSFRSRVSDTSDCSQDERSTPLASPGRAWAQHTAEALLLEPLSLEQQDVSTARVSAQDAAAAETAAKPAAALQLSDMQQQPEALAFDDCDLRCQSPCSVSSEDASAQDVVGPPVGLPAVAVPALEFKGFGAAGAPQQPALAATDSIHLETPRLEPRWAPAGSNCSSSNGTAGGSDEQFFSITGGSSDATAAQGGAAGTAGAFSLPGAASAAMCEQLNQPLPAGVSVHVAAGARFSTAWDLATGCAGASFGAATSAVSGVVSAQQDEYDSPGYWSCDEDDDCDTAAAADEDDDCDTAAAGGLQGTEQFGGPPLTPAGAQAMPAAEPAVESEPSQLTLSPLLLKQLTQSFHEAGEPDPPHPSDDDATTCCDWATVCSYEEYE